MSKIYKPKSDFQETQTKKLKPLEYYIQWLFSWVIVLSSVSLFSCSSGHPHSYSYPIAPENINSHFMKLKIKGSIAINSGSFNSIPVTELSGIAWDNDDQILYAVSDEGYLYHFKVTLTNNQLSELQVTFATKLVDKFGAPLKGKYTDSEGLSTLNSNNGKRGDTQLLISFENKPRIVKFSTKGKAISKIKLPKKIKKKNRFRHKNKALESITYHPRYGVITAAEYPIKLSPTNIQTLYSIKGEEWKFERSTAKNSAITGLEVLDNGDVLVLERAYNNPFKPLVINLRRLKLNECDSNRMCTTEPLARFDSSEGWAVDNFEGLALFKDNHYFMISDDNNNPLQKTILVLLEVIDTTKTQSINNSKN